MKQTVFIILTLFLIYSCKDKTTKDIGQNTFSIPDRSNNDSLIQNIAEPSKNKPVLDSSLADAFAKAVQSFPEDSTSLYRFYFKVNTTTDQEKVNKRIDRLNKLTTKESVESYQSIKNNLIPLMTRIVNSSSMSKSQCDSLVKLYSGYDHFAGESLFSGFLTNDNYKLVWGSIKIMVKESAKDTCFISGLIQLNDNIRTNVELAEAMEDFIVQSVRNNPLGFLVMYSRRKGEQRALFANNISLWDDPDMKLMEKFTEISEHSQNKYYRQLAKEFIEGFKK